MRVDVVASCESWLWLGYWWLKTSYGLWRHPYSTMSLLVQHRWRQAVIFAPTLYFTVLLVSWRWVGRTIVTTFLTANCTLMLIKTSVVFYALAWQMSLLYLWLKFRRYRKVL